MGKVMLDVVKLAGEALPGKLLGEEHGERLALLPVPQAIEHEADARGRGDEIAELAQPVGAAVLVDGDMIDVGERESRLAQAVGDCLRREPGPMLKAPKALLLGRG